MRLRRLPTVVADVAGQTISCAQAASDSRAIGLMKFGLLSFVVANQVALQSSEITGAEKAQRGAGHTQWGTTDILPARP